MRDNQGGKTSTNSSWLFVTDFSSLSSPLVPLVAAVLLLLLSCFAALVSGKQVDKVSAKVEGAIFVRESDGTQSFVGGATVKLTGPVTLEAQTDENGKFSLSAVPFGTYAMVAFSPGLSAEASISVRVEYAP